LVKSGRTYDRSTLAILVGLNAFRAPDVIAFHPRTGGWRFIEVKRTERSVRWDQLLSLAAAKQFLEVEVEVIFLRENREAATTLTPLNVTLPFHRCDVETTLTDPL
jgi:hypothetical protein